jgi:hypothetical protein
MESFRPQLQGAYFEVTFAIKVNNAVDHFRNSIKVGNAVDHFRNSLDQLTCPTIPILCPEL